MIDETFRIVAYQGRTEGTIIAQALELGQMGSGKTLDEAVKSAITTNGSLLQQALLNKTSYLNPAPEEIWDLHTLGEKPYKIEPVTIKKREDDPTPLQVEFRCYDKTHLSPPYPLD